jgi:hypothetical protein
MSINDHGQITSRASQSGPGAGFLGPLRRMALIAVTSGAAGSVAFTIRAGHRNPSRVLIVLFAIWVLSPFVALVLSNIASRSWSVITRPALYSVTLVLTVGSLAIYGYVVLTPPRSAFVFVVVPPASWLLIAIVVSMAALISRRMSRRDTDASQR